MNDLISRQEAIDALRLIPCDLGKRELEDAIKAVEQLPSVQPEIIRCKDCEHWDKTWTNDWGKDYHYCFMVDSVRKGDFYCADAERRTDE